MEVEAALFYGFIALFIIAIVTIILLLIHSGFFTEIIVQSGKPELGEITIAYKFERGAYKNSGSLFTEAHTLLPQYRSIGVYYDDPRKVKEPYRLRYIVGLIVAENEQTVNPEDKKMLENNGFKFTTLPAVNHAVHTSFPFKSTISIVVGIFRVYPTLNEYVETRGLCAHPYLEIYDNEKSQILFVGPLEKQDSFYVPEVLEPFEESLQGDEPEDEQSLSWDDSASYIKSDILDENPSAGSSASSIADDDGQDCSASEPESERGLAAAGSSSSFEEIDEKDAPTASAVKCSEGKEL